MTKASKKAGSTFETRWLRGSVIAVAMAAACMMFGTATLKADCGIPAKQLSGAAFKPAAFITMAPENNQDSDRAQAGFIGYWHVKLILTGGILREKSFSRSSI